MVNYLRFRVRKGEILSQRERRGDSMKTVGEGGWVSAGLIHTKVPSILCDGSVDRKNYSSSRGTAGFHMSGLEYE